MVVTLGLFDESSVYHNRNYLWFVANSELHPPNSLTLFKMFVSEASKSLHLVLCQSFISIYLKQSFSQSPFFFSSYKFVVITAFLITMYSEINFLAVDCILPFVIYFYSAVAF